MIQLEKVDDDKQDRMNEKINLELIKLSEDIKNLYAIINNIKLSLGSA